jgi:hypothetical protein
MEGRKACKRLFVGREDVENAVIVGLLASPGATDTMRRSWNLQVKQR